jgi:hypothetical protein
MCPSTKAGQALADDPLRLSSRAVELSQNFFTTLFYFEGRLEEGIYTLGGDIYTLRLTSLESEVYEKSPALKYSP